MCVTNSSMSMSNCTMECCNSSLCLQLNATAYGNQLAWEHPRPLATGLGFSLVARDLASLQQIEGTEFDSAACGWRLTCVASHIASGCLAACISLRWREPGCLE